MTDSAIKYVGVDGCKGGWIGVGLSDDGRSEVAVCADFSDIVACFGDACVIFVDIPIGLYEDATPRACDKEARKKLGTKRHVVVFPAPPRPFVDKVALTPDWDWTAINGKHYRDACAEASQWHRDKFSGKGVSAQAFSITPKIGEMDEFLRTRDADSPKIREVHPEICFWALNGGNPDSAMAISKKKPAGFKKRIETLRRCAQDINGIDVDAIFKKARDKFPKKKVADDDILDAIAVAITAKIGCENGFMTLPDDPPKDSKGLPMEMVYALPNDEGTPC